ncbi:MAG TPA: DUF1858 domain-containing protein [Candidatus Peribacterales bacterium]|nr:DUF1858 domain-containing protein [Candidatus Peribacterales bacterium]
MEDGVSQPGIKVTKRPHKRVASTKKSEVVVTADWTVAEIVGQYPQVTEVLAEYGLHCFGCAASGLESIAEGCRGHGFSEEDILLLIDDLNDAIAHMPVRPQTLTITKDAALGIREIAIKEKVEEQGLSVQANRDGSFYMEFREKIEKGEIEFHHSDVPDVKIWASILTLQRIGGAVITLKDGKFKLEVGEGCCREKTDCSCHTEEPELTK